MGCLTRKRALKLSGCKEEKGKNQRWRQRTNVKKKFKKEEKEDEEDKEEEEENNNNLFLHLILLKKEKSQGMKK